MAIAVMLLGADFCRRHVELRAAARRHTRAAANYRTAAGDIAKELGKYPIHRGRFCAYDLPPNFSEVWPIHVAGRQSIGELNRLSGEHIELALKYERASRFPWQLAQIKQD